MQIYWKELGGSLETKNKANGKIGDILKRTNRKVKGEGGDQNVKHK